MVLLIVLAPLLLAIAIVITLADGGPPLYWQRRVGYGGREFWFPKFRSMRVDADRLQGALRRYADHSASLTFKMRRDPRLTAIGRPLRTFSLDELPQLWCVLRGEMSMVGPRPPLPEEVAQYSETARRRLHVRPGLTCIWQVSGRSDIPFASQVVLDLHYIRHQSLWLDLKLVLLTIPAVLSGRGAY
jgi:lipopolysaccharide/colanic/teichoic acid biosynthesis glycosyltransferase